MYQKLLGEKWSLYPTNCMYKRSEISLLNEASITPRKLANVLAILQPHDYPSIWSGYVSEARGVHDDLLS